MKIVLRIWVIIGFCFLSMPLLAIIPLSFTAGQYMFYTPEMLTLDPAGYSTRWYADVLNSPDWILAVQNSLLIGAGAALLATTCGTLAAIGLSWAGTPFKGLWTVLILLPQVVPIVVIAGGLFAAFGELKLIGTYSGIIIAHTVLAAPVAVITIRASMDRFDWGLVAAASTLGAGPAYTFRKVTLPLVRPAIIAGAIFSFATSLDEVVVIQFIGAYDQKTIPIQMLIGLREHLSPAILAVATMLIGFALVVIVLGEALRRRSVAYGPRNK